MHTGAAGAARPPAKLPVMRPSMLLLLAGLLAADRLRRSGASWTGAPLGPIAAKPLCDRDLSRRLPRRRKSMRHRLFVFVLFVALLVVVPAVFVRVLW